jgi:hypothetical protein
MCIADSLGSRIRALFWLSVTNFVISGADAIRGCAYMILNCPTACSTAVLSPGRLSGRAQQRDRL